MTIYLIQMAAAALSQLVCAEPRISRAFKKAALFSVLLLLVLASAFRYGIGGDYGHYVNMYNVALLQGSKDFYTEPGFNILLMILARTGLPAQSLFIVSSVLLGVGLWHFITRCAEERYWGLAVFLFVSFGFYYSSLNVLRQYMAFSVGLFALTALKDQQMKIFLLLVVIASLFHTAAVFLLLAPLFSLLAKSKYGYGITVVLYIVSLSFLVVDIRPVISMLSVFVERWSGYSDSAYFTDRNASAVLKLVVPNLLMIWYLVSDTRKLPSEGKGADSMWSDIALVGMLYVFMQNAFFGVMVLTRIPEMFGMCFVLWIVGVVSRNKGSSTRFLFELLLYAYGFILTWVTIFQMNGNGVMPYQSIF